MFCYGKICRIILVVILFYCAIIRDRYCVCDLALWNWSKVTWPSALKNKYSKTYAESRNLTNELEDKVQLFQRIGMAVFGGVFLIGPMFIMVSHQTLRTSLPTTSLCVVAYGLLLAVFWEDPFHVLSGTAGYAAVQVVFVGTSGAST